MLSVAVALPLALGEIAPGFVGVAAAAALGLLAAVLADFSAAAAPWQIEVRRLHHPRLYLAEENPIDIEVNNRGGRPLRLRVRDTPPVSFRSSTLFVGGQVGPRSRASFRYWTRPVTRGAFRFGDVTFRWRTPLGLLWRQRTVPQAEEVNVYPNLTEVQKYDLLARRGLLREMGLRSSRHRDRGTEFESLRDYLPDDDFRRINWKATARRQRPVTTLYESERSQRFIIMLDLGRMMLTPVGELTRLDAAVNAAVLLAYVALARGDRVGLMAFSDSVQSYTPPRKGRGQFYRILEQLYDVRAQPIESDYGEAFGRLRADLRGRSLLALFTDLSDPEVATLVARHMALVARHHLPLCITLSDPLVQELAGAIPNSGRDLYRKLVALRLQDERSMVLENLGRAGVLTVDAPAGRLTPATINRYLELKERALL